MPMISVRIKNLKINPIAIKGLTQVIAKRMNIDLTFEKPALVRGLILFSGGSLREPLRLTDGARLHVITAVAKKSALSLENSLAPANVYFSILAEISVHKKFETDQTHGFSLEFFETRRGFYHTLTAQGVVLAYNGAENWYAVDPVLHTLKSFREALSKVLQSST